MSRSESTTPAPASESAAHQGKTRALWFAYAAVVLIYPLGLGVMLAGTGAYWIIPAGGVGLAMLGVLFGSLASYPTRLLWSAAPAAATLTPVFGIIYVLGYYLYMGWKIARGQ